MASIKELAEEVLGHASYTEDDGEQFTIVQTEYLNELLNHIFNSHDALVEALTLIAYRYESGDIGDLVNDMPEIEAALEAAK